jgi:hypothetical protein
MILHCFYCDNLDERMIKLHKEASSLVGIEVQYWSFSIAELASKNIRPHVMHGLFLEQLLRESPSEVVGIIDADCILSSADFLASCQDKVKKSGTVIGLAQCANHLPSRNHIYAAPAFMLVNAEAWHDLGRPSLAPDFEFDTAQRLSHVLEAENLPVDIIMPDCHTRLGQIWQLGGKGTYGIGTCYGERHVFHLFQSARGPSYLFLLDKQVQKLRDGAKVF